MRQTRIFLNAIIDGTLAPFTPDGALNAPSEADARHALARIEVFDLAVNALRLVVDNPKNPEAFAHATRMLASYDAYLARYPLKEAAPPPAHPIVPSDGSDLV